MQKKTLILFGDSIDEGESYTLFRTLPELLDNPLVLPPKGHSILRKRLKPKTQSPLSSKEDQGLLPLEWGLDCDHYQLSSNDTPVGNVSRRTSTQRREQVP